MSLIHCKRFSSSDGFTLIEVLVALIVVSIGLLGLAGLQATSVRFNQQAYLRSQAVQQAYDMADRIRANARGMWDGDYDDIDGTESDPACIDTDCSPADLATTDAVAWNAQNVSVLPGSYLSREVEGVNPGQGHVRMALVAPLEECVEAARRMSELLTG